MIPTVWVLLIVANDAEQFLVIVSEIILNVACPCGHLQACLALAQLLIAINSSFPSVDKAKVLKVIITF